MSRNSINLRRDLCAKDKISRGEDRRTRGPEKRLMKRYDNIVLNRLLDSYENSAAYMAEHAAECSDSAAPGGDPVPECGHHPRRRGVFCHIDKKNFPDYFDTSSGAYEMLHAQLQELEQKGMIRLYWRGGIKGHILEKAALELDNVGSCYRFLKRKQRWEKEAKISGICRKYLSLAVEKGSCETECEAERTGISGRAESTAILTAFLEWIMDRLQSGESIKRYADIDDPSGFDRICRLLLAVLTNKREQYLRQFSIGLFSDSKVAEKELEKALSVIREFSPAYIDCSGLSSEHILEMFGIYRNPVWLYMKGFAVIGTGDVRGGTEAGEADLKPLENGIGFTLRDLASVRPDPAYPPEIVLTVENLTSYYRQDVVISGRKALVIYLGGFAGRQKREFLMKLRETFPSAGFMHSGDIDCGGFRIWKSLCEGTGIWFEPYNMDAETFRKFSESGRPLTSHDREILGSMKRDPFFREQWELFDLMLDTGIKLEQEGFE